MQQPDLSVIRDDVRAMSAYAVPDATGLIKLDAMENPFGLPHELAQTLGAHLASVCFNRYPPSNPSAFKSRLAGHMGVPGPSHLLLGNGSDELIHLICQACARPGATVLAPWPSFSMYEVLARLNQCRFVGVPLKPDFQLDGDALLAAIAEHRPAVTFVAYPNNPTGSLFDRQLLAQAIEAAAPGLVVIDEAYLPYARDTWMPQLGEFPNLAVLRTVSKLGLAGLRLGYLAAHPAWVGEFDKVRPPYNINALTLAATNFLLEYLEVFDAQADVLRAQRSCVLGALRTLPGVTAFDSAANFILFRVQQADAVFEALRLRGVLIKNLSAAHPLLKNCLRATIGTRDENLSFLKALESSLAAQENP